MDYEDFLATKIIKAEPSGVEVDAAEIPPVLFDFQRDIVRVASVREEVYA